MKNQYILHPRIDTLYISYSTDHLSLDNPEHIENVILKFRIQTQKHTDEIYQYDTKASLVFYIGKKYQSHTHLESLNYPLDNQKLFDG